MNEKFGNNNILDSNDNYHESLDKVDNNVSGYTRNEDGIYVQNAGGDGD